MKECAMYLEPYGSLIEECIYLSLSLYIYILYMYTYICIYIYTRFKLCRDIGMPIYLI